MTTRRIRTAIDLVVAEGFCIDEIRNSKHTVVKAHHPDGTKRVFTIPGTPSDFRSLRNFRSQVRRSLRSGT
jgi:hypothetical protein